MRGRFVIVLIGLMIGVNFCFAQQSNRTETIEFELQAAISQLEKALMTTDTNVLKSLLHTDLSMGHSNGWIENKEDILVHLQSGFLVYNEIKPIGAVQVNSIGNFARVRRKIEVKGIADKVKFEMELKVLEVWVLELGKWKLWSRQSLKV